MDSKALINETLKYLEKDENNKPKYRFQVYSTGIANYYKQQLSGLTMGMVNLGQTKEEETMPVSVYTIADVFNTVADVHNDVLTNIQALPGTLDNIKASMKQLGSSALDSTINTIKTAIIPIETLQTVESIYRVAKPLVEKIVNIASIKFHFENAALVAQDVLQYLGRLAVSTARNMLDKLWNIFMDTPIFAVYENDNTVNLTEVYADLSEAANKIIDKLTRDTDAIYNMIEYINGSEFTTTSPKYNKFGIIAPGKIVDVYSDPNTRKIYVATKNSVSVIESNFSTTELFSTPDEILRIYIYNNELYYITSVSDKFIIKSYNGNEITVKREIPKTENQKIDIIFSDPIFLYIIGTKELYSGDGATVTALTLSNDMLYQCHDITGNIIYYIGRDEDKYTLWQICKVEDDNGEITYYSTRLYNDSDEIFGIRYFNNTLYLVKKNDEDKYYLSKVNAGRNFERNGYNYRDFTVDGKNIIWTDGNKYATDGSNIFTVNNNNLTYKYKIDSANCITEQTYNSKKYLVCTGGVKIYVSQLTNNGTIQWYEKIINTTNDSEELEKLAELVPDNMAGCLWVKNSYGDNFLAYSQQRVYTFGPKDINQLFNFVDTREIPDLLNKKFVSFEDWFEEDDKVNFPFVVPSSKTEIEGGCIITAIRYIDKKLYIALFSPKNNNIKCGIYPCSISRVDNVDTFLVDYSHPVFSSDKKIKIYSFNVKNGEWYYIDSNNLYNITTKSNTDLKLEELNDGALTITDKINIYTAKALLKHSQVKSSGKVTSLAKYESTDLPQIASTRNIMMFSDDKHVYSIVDNGEDAINYDMFQICYSKLADEEYKLIQSNDAAFIVSGNAIMKLPFYSSIDSCEYGCGYYVDTTPNKWHGAAPYYFVSNILNEGKNSIQRDSFLFSFKENFKVELQKLLVEIPDAFVGYMKNQIKDKLAEVNIEIDGDDGQILDLIKNSVASTTATSLGMYIQEKFMQKIGDDDSYEDFATTVYKACKEDPENNMTRDFYEIFEEFVGPLITSALMNSKLGRDGLSSALLRYYQNHKAEWATSMTDLIDIDVVDPDIYEMPLKATQILSKKTYRFSYPDNEYKFEFIPNPSSKFSSNNIISGYYYDGKFYSDQEHTEEIDPREKDAEGNYTDSSGNIICYYDSKNQGYYKYKLTDYIETEDTTVVSDKDYYKKTGDDVYIYTPTIDETEIEGKMYFAKILVPSIDTSIVDDKEYFSRSSGSYTYELTDTSDYGGDYIEENGHYVYNPDSTQERFFITFIPFVPENYTTSYEITEDTEVIDGKTYYVKNGSNYIEVENPEGNPHANGWYEEIINFSGSGDYILQDGHYVYSPGHTDIETYTVASYMSSNGILKIAPYYQKGLYFETEDTELDTDKTYYTQNIVEASGIISSAIQYYEYQYVLTEDTSVDIYKEYYEYIDLSYTEQLLLENGFIPAPIGTTETRYKISYTQLDGDFDRNEIYFIEQDGAYVEAEELDIQKGPYYYIDGMAQDDENGDYIKVTSSSQIPSSNYVKVQNPTVDGLKNYYERELVAIPTPTTIDNKYVKVYEKVETPTISELSTYYEKSDEFVPASEFHYAHDAYGATVGIIDDRIFYKAIFTNGDYTEVIIEEEDQRNPNRENWYEYDYVQVESGTMVNPRQEGLYNRTPNDITFTKVENPEGNPRANGWYEYGVSYSNIYDDDKVYIDLIPLTIESNFPELDDAWHGMFYDVLNGISASVSQMTDVEQAKNFAISSIDSINYKFQPDWQWKDLITQSVAELYIPTQGEQYRQIVLNSDMYPIQWDELPKDIDGEAFDYALTALLYAIKQRLIANITMLVDNGKVRCYSCIDASTVINKIINRNSSIWSRQGKKIRENILKATSIVEIVSALSVIKSYDPTLFLLENILVDQSKLYASYIDMIIDEQVIKDNDTEVIL